MKKCIELSIYSVNPSNSETIENLSDFQTKYCEWLDSPDGRRLEVQETILDDVKDFLKLEGHEIRDGISDGCYGARPGTTSKGITIWIDPLTLCERFIDSDGDEMVNVAHLLESHGTYKPDLNADAIEELLYDSDCEVKHDNSYNWQGQNSEDPLFMFDFDFKLIELNNSAYMIIRFHCGGDPRGNYTDEMVYKFDSIEDVYIVIYPQRELTDDQDA